MVIIEIGFLLVGRAGGLFLVKPGVKVGVLQVLSRSVVLEYLQDFFHISL